MSTTLGPHLLGRKPQPVDVRDYRLVDSLDPLDVALAVVMSSHESKATKAWAQLVTARLHTGPTPDPVPAPQDIIWTDADQTLDQGDTPHCVGAAWAGWADTLPVDDHYTMTEGNAIYFEAKVIDGEPGQEDGTDVRSGAKAMKNRGRLSAYAFASSVAEVIAFVSTHGPVVIGSDWHDSMFTPDSRGYVQPSGSVAGGHAYLCTGYLASENALLFRNSWGDWGPLHGLFKMTLDDFGQLLAAQGDACAATELPLA